MCDLICPELIIIQYNMTYVCNHRVHCKTTRKRERERKGQQESTNQSQGEDGKKMQLGGIDNEAKGSKKPGDCARLSMNVKCKW